MSTNWVTEFFSAIERGRQAKAKEEDRKLERDLLQQRIRELKINEALENRQAREQSAKMMEGRPGPQVPGMSLPGIGQVAPPSEQLPHPPIAIPEVNVEGFQVPGYSYQPQTQQDIARQNLERLSMESAAKAPPPQASVLSPGAIKVDPSGRTIASNPVAEKPPAPMTDYQMQSLQLRRDQMAQGNKSKLLTPEEEAQQVRIAGAKAEATAAAKPKLTGKDVMTAKGKLDKLNLAKRQIADIQARFDEAKGIAAGPLTGELPFPKGKALDKAIDAFRQTFVALTRTPGVGQMSDFESRMAMAALPKRSDYEDVTQQSIDQLKMMVQELATGYGDLLSAPAEQPQTTAQPIYATNPKTGVRIMSTDGGQTWRPAR